MISHVHGMKCNMSSYQKFHQGFIYIGFKVLLSKPADRLIYFIKLTNVKQASPAVLLVGADQVVSLAFSEDALSASASYKSSFQPDGLW